MSKKRTWAPASENARAACEQILREFLRRTKHPAKLELVPDMPTSMKPARPPILRFEDLVVAKDEYLNSVIYAVIQRSTTCADTIFLLWIDGLCTVGVCRIFESFMSKKVESAAAEKDPREVLRRLTFDCTNAPQYILIYNGKECYGPCSNFEAQVRNLLSYPAGNKPLECVVCFEQFASTWCRFKCGHAVACADCTPKLASCVMCRETEHL